MHYTSIENIHKVIDPLFLDGLKAEFAEIRELKVVGARNKRLAAFQDKLAGLSFLDPAYGSGNFLTETYLSLRKLENEALRLLNAGQGVLDFGDAIKVTIGRFYGIEINDFAVTAAKTALWIAENQTMRETMSIVHRNLDFLPLKSYANIVEGNALRLDWRYLYGAQAPSVPSIYANKTTVMLVREPVAHYGEINLFTKELVEPQTDDAPLKPLRYDYIMGNPPFVGYSLQSKGQKGDILSIYVDENGKPYNAAGKIDYVAGWYFKAAQFIAGTSTRVAFLSTNSVTQGEQAASVWKPLYESFGIHIDFAHRTFSWDSESSHKAQVHCVIVGFSCVRTGQARKIFDESGTPHPAQNISPYLIDAPNVFIESRNNAVMNPFCQGVSLHTTRFQITP